MKKNILYKRLLLLAFFLVSFNSLSQSCYRVYVNFIVDYDYYALNDHDENQIRQDITNWYNTSVPIYRNGVSIELIMGRDIQILTNEASDPFSGLNSNHTQLFNVLDAEWPTSGGQEVIVSPYDNRLNMVVDINVLFTGKSNDNFGIARGSAAYNTSGTGSAIVFGLNTYIDSSTGFPEELTVSRTDSQLEATYIHEIGHLFGCPDLNCSSGNPDIMCQGNNSTPGVFSDLAKEYINNASETYHKDYLYSTGDAEPLENSDSQLFADKAHYTSGNMIINDIDVNVFSFLPQISLTTLLLKSSEAIKISGDVKLKGSSGQIIMQGSRAELNDYCSSNVSSFRFASLKTDERDILKTLNKPESEIERVRLFPNPVTDYLNIDITLTKKSLVNVAVYNLSGRFLFDLLKNKELNEGSHQKEFDISKLAQGYYVIKIDTEKGSKSYQIIKE